MSFPLLTYVAEPILWFI